MSPAFLDHPDVQWPGPVPLRPLRIGEILSVGVRLAAANLLRLAPLALALGAAGAAVQFAVLKGSGALPDYLAFGLTADTAAEVSQLERLVWPLLLASWCTVVVSQIGGQFLAGVAAPLVGRASVDDHSGRPLGRLAGRWAALIGVSVATGAAVSVGLLVLIVPGILIWLALLAAGPVAAMEGSGVAASLRRAAALSVGLRARSLGVLVLAAPVSGGLSLVIGTLVDRVAALQDLTAAYLLATATGVVVGAFTGAWTAMVTALLYVDMRFRKEDLGRALWVAAHQARLS